MVSIKAKQLSVDEFYFLVKDKFSERIVAIIIR